ncbi:MAG: asparagine synthase (glutamine-hydrolyzing) [Candidatus Rokubacteria bacterium]|nr:asparagine synthase (glutamine-hydrolyzing) [Candidatus Rokubacteria bacterium]
MSGIAGIYDREDRPVAAALLKRMTDVIARRGPDGEGHWIEGSVGLGHRLLQTTPASLQETQPMLDGTRRWVITADARIDNRDELIATLELCGDGPGKITDAELILKAYEKWGEACPGRLIGDFAFAIWDRRARRLFCARDPIGIKPFHYHFDGKRFIWASEPKQILEDRSVSPEPNLSLIGRYLLDDGSEREETLYRGIYRLPQAHCLVVGDTGIRKSQYWDVDESREVRYHTDAQYAEHFLNLFSRAVRSHLRSGGPVGAFLSGGLDSSSVVSMAQKLYGDGEVTNNGFETYSIVFDTLRCDERRYIDEVVRKWGFRANYVGFEQHESAVNLEESWQYPDVIYDPMTFMSHVALDDARQKGIKVFLSGVGGDELLACGFEHLTDLLYRGRIRALMEQLDYDAVNYAVSRKHLLWNYCVKPLIPSPIKTLLKPAIMRLRDKRVHGWFAPGFLERARLEGHWRRGVKVKKFCTRAQQALYEGLHFTWNANFSLGMLDSSHAAFSTECRYPFFDRRLVEFLMAIPDEQRWWMDRPKAILRRALAGILPEAVGNRRGKAEFTPAFDREMAERQADKVEALLCRSALERLGVIDGERFRRFVAEYRAGLRGAARTSVVSTFVGLELWCRHCIMSSARGG